MTENCEQQVGLFVYTPAARERSAGGVDAEWHCITTEGHGFNR
jgi:hypothetical protein